MLEGWQAATEKSRRGVDLRALYMAGLCILCAVLLWRVGTLLLYLNATLLFPYSLDYGEGIVWQQMRDMLRGTAYAPLGTFPAIVFHYPPVFHLTSAVLAAVADIDQLVAGRLVSIVSTFATAVMVGLLVARASPEDSNSLATAVCGTLAGLLFLSCNPVQFWTPFMRVDMLSGALGMAGILLAIHALRRPGWIYGAAVMFVLSVYTKQISIAAPAATFSTLLLVRPRLAFQGVACCLTLGLLALGWLSWQTDGQFLTHIVFYNINRFDPLLLVTLMLQIIGHMMLIVLAVMGALTSWRQIRSANAALPPLDHICEHLKRDASAVPIAILLTFFALKTLMLPSSMKSGAGTNYMIEWLCVVSIFAGLAIRPIAARAIGFPIPSPNPSKIRAAIILISLPLQFLVAPINPIPDGETARRTKQAHAKIVERIAASSQPVVSDDMTLPIRAGRDVLWESAITAELGQSGVYDQAAFIRLVRARCFGLFVLEGRTDRRPFLVRYNRPVAAAILTAYPREEKIGIYTLRWPPANATPNARCPTSQRR